jgi:hypothetical protein
VDPAAAWACPPAAADPPAAAAGAGDRGSKTQVVGDASASGRDFPEGAEE